MESITWLSLGFSIASFILAATAIALHLFDRPRLKILSIRPGISGSLAATDRQWKHNVSCIEVIIENKGTRSAIDCEAVITFPQMEALPIYPQTKDSTIDFQNRTFNVLSKSKIRLVGAWHITTNGGIDGTKESISLGDFLTKCTPTSVIVSFGNNKIKGMLTREEAQKIFDEHQTSKYINQVR